MPVVLDASAYLAYLLDEPGSEVVAAAIEPEGAMICSVNLAEVLAKLEDRKPGLLAGITVPLRHPGESELTPAGYPLKLGTVTVEPFTFGDAATSAIIRTATKPHGLSPGDRACLALAKRLGAEALTADQAWKQVEHAVGVRVRVIR